MHESLKIMIAAARQTPRLYFAPLIAMFSATRDVQREMSEAVRNRP
jgi:hypothetical protein